MPRLPRELSGRALAKLLERYGYRVTRQVGSHIRLTTDVSATEHHITIPDHTPLKVGMLSSILKDVSEHLKKDREVLVRELFE